MNSVGIEQKEPPDDVQGVKDGVLSERHCSILASDLKADSVGQIEKDGVASDVNRLDIKQVQHQQQTSNGKLVLWERFLHVRSIKVLLVENDDSTRHVVTALLRNCNYEVLNAANGLQAWKLLEDLSNHVDIILTEVVMPIVSGIGLLYKIMSHKTRKNIPVIMMSSHDSMGIVFKCLSRGAVDFLVKPIRKNELKNLWQHVWRRCHSSSGSGSESGTHTHKSLKSDSSEKSGNSSSDNGENGGSNGQNSGDRSDDGSGSQSSWTRRAVEVDSSLAVSPTDQSTECPDSTCAQVIRPNAENTDNIREQLSLARQGPQQKLSDNVEKNNKDMETNPVPVPTNPAARKSVSTSSANRINSNQYENGDSKESSLELSLKRLKRVQDMDRTTQEDRCVLRRSEQSAFSRYNTSTNAFKSPNAITGSSTIIDNSMEAVRRESVAHIQIHSYGHIPLQCSNGIGTTVDMGSSTDMLCKDKYEGTSAVNGFDPSAELRHNQQKANLPMQPRYICGSKQEFRLQYPNGQDFARSSCRFHIDQPSSNHPESSSMKLAVDASHCGSTNAVSGPPMDVENRHDSFNRSNSGSNHASNGPIGSNSATNTGGNNAESGIDQAGKSGNGDASGSVTGNRDEESKLKRQAALIKFRQKRKERCFKKKVICQSKKKIAEQKPRVRGQFVKQTETDSSNRTGDE